MQTHTFLAFWVLYYNLNFLFTQCQGTFFSPVVEKRVRKKSQGRDKYFPQSHMTAVPKLQLIPALQLSDVKL